jgi:UDP-N-acetylglucosamine diphosphorylase/glucosamine-1-phosphate N-acetyltransferase
MNFILFDGPLREKFLPLTFTRPVAHLHVGISSIKEKWEQYLNTTCTVLTTDYLEDKFPMVEWEQNLFIEATYLPNQVLVNQIKALSKNQMLVHEGEVVAFFLEASQKEVDFESYQSILCEEVPLRIVSLLDLSQKNKVVFEADFEKITKDRISQPLSKTNHVICPERIFLEEGAVVEFSFLNASEGPIYLGKKALVMEGAMIRGAFSLGDGSVVKMGSKIYGASSVGKNSVVGGELKNSIVMNYSNKGHDGYLGDSIVGDWCNLGANTTGSNMKNNYSKIKVWSYELDEFKELDTLKFGQVFGDYTRTSIGTCLNTGTIVGVGANVFDVDFSKKFIPSFSWGNEEETRLEDFFKTVERIRVLRGFDFSRQEKKIVQSIFETTQKYRDL